MPGKSNAKLSGAGWMGFLYGTAAHEPWLQDRCRSRKNHVFNHILPIASKYCIPYIRNAKNSLHEVQNLGVICLSSSSLVFHLTKIKKAMKSYKNKHKKDNDTFVIQAATLHKPVWTLQSLHIIYKSTKICRLTTLQTMLKGKINMKQTCHDSVKSECENVDLEDCGWVLLLVWTQSQWMKSCQLKPSSVNQQP